MTDSIYEERYYRREMQTEDGNQVQEIVRLKEVTTGDIRFVGSADVVIQVDPRIPPQKMTLNFEIDADTIHEAFDQFAERAHAELEEQKPKIREEIQRRFSGGSGPQQKQGNIIRPGQGNPSPEQLSKGMKNLKGGE